MSSLFDRLVALNTAGPYSAPAVTAETALPGHDQPELVHPKPHTVLGTPIDGPWKEGQESIVLAIGCYWGAEKLMWNIPGVESTAVGFSGGYTRNATYDEVCTGRTGQAEAVQVVWDPAKVSLETILATALENHDPTQGDRQGNDVGSQYRSAIYPTTPEQFTTAQDVVKRYGQKLKDAGYGEITTEVIPLDQTPTGSFDLARDDHQQYLDKNPNGYCPVHATGVSCN